MIGDQRIDLTIDMKFGSAPRSSDMMRLITEINQFPWNQRRIETQEQLQSTRAVRSFGDPLSDEMDCVVRTCWGGKWFFGQRLKPWWYQGAFDETLMELGIFDTVRHSCFRCLKTQIGLNGFDICYDCQIEEACDKTYKKLFPDIKNERYIAWEDHVRPNWFSDDRIPTTNFILSSMYKSSNKA